MTRLSSQITNPEETIQLKVLQALVAIATTLDLHDQQLGEVPPLSFQTLTFRSSVSAFVYKPIKTAMQCTIPPPLHYDNY